MELSKSSVREKIPRKSYGEMALAAIGAINDEIGSTEDDISYYISAYYDGLPPNHSDFVRVNLAMLLLDQQMIGARLAYFIKDHPNESISNPTALDQEIINAIKELDDKGGSTAYSIEECICKSYSPGESSEVSSHLEEQLEMLVGAGVLGVNNVYFLLAKGRFWLQRIKVPDYNDPSLDKWKRRNSTKYENTASLEGNTVQTAPTHWEEGEGNTNIKEKPMARIMRETEPQDLMMEWTPENYYETS